MVRWNVRRSNDRSAIRNLFNWQLKLVRRRTGEAVEAIRAARVSADAALDANRHHEAP